MKTGFVKRIANRIAQKLHFGRKNYSQANRSPESGRSMVEILGVLAIMGVLSIGGIWLYRYSMDMIMANSIVTGVRARSVIVGQQRVLEQPLNLQEFHPETEKDLIFGKFEVEAFNDYNQECTEAGCQKVALNCAIADKDKVQALEVYDIPYDVCEKLKRLQFVDPTCNTINGDVYMRFDGWTSPQINCIPDGSLPEDNIGQDSSVLLAGEYHNVATFVFDNGVGEDCECDADCGTGCCLEHVCVPSDGREQCTECRCGICQKWNEERLECVPDEEEEEANKQCGSLYDPTLGKDYPLCCQDGECKRRCPSPSSSSSSTTSSSMTSSSTTSSSTTSSSTTSSSTTSSSTTSSSTTSSSTTSSSMTSSSTTSSSTTSSSTTSSSTTSSSTTSSSTTSSSTTSSSTTSSSTTSSSTTSSSSSSSSSNPCEGSDDPCCDSDDPCCGSGDPCCGSEDPCCGGDSCCGLAGQALTCCQNPCGPGCSDSACCQNPESCDCNPKRCDCPGGKVCTGNSQCVGGKCVGPCSRDWKGPKPSGTRCCDSNSDCASDGICEGVCVAGTCGTHFKGGKKPPCMTCVSGHPQSEDNGKIPEDEECKQCFEGGLVFGAECCRKKGNPDPANCKTCQPNGDGSWSVKDECDAAQCMACNGKGGCEFKCKGEEICCNGECADKDKCKCIQEQGGIWLD